MKSDLNGAFNPWIIGIDFELAFIKMCRQHWPLAILIGCFFHFSQAIVKQLKDELGFPKEVIHQICRIVQLATVLPQEDLQDITGKGWGYLAKKIAEITVDEDVDGWMQSDVGMSKKAALFVYFRDFWSREDILPIWNCSAFAAAEEGDLQPAFRTNCWSERNNRTTNEKFSAPHPTLGNFTQTLREEMDSTIAKQEEYRTGKADPPTYAPVQWPKIPADYAEFEVPADAWILSIADRPKKRARKTKKKN